MPTSLGRMQSRIHPRSLGMIPDRRVMTTNPQAGVVGGRLDLVRVRRVSVTPPAGAPGRQMAFAGLEGLGEGVPSARTAGCPGQGAGSTLPGPRLVCVHGSRFWSPSRTSTFLFEPPRPGARFVVWPPRPRRRTVRGHPEFEKLGPCGWIGRSPRWPGSGAMPGVFFSTGVVESSDVVFEEETGDQFAS